MTRTLSEGFEELVTMLAPRTIVEVGAHEASFSCKLKKRVPSARVVAFEANPDVHAKYEDEVTSHGVEYVSRCISDVSETVRFSMPIHPKHGAATGMGSVMTDTGYEEFKTYDVPAVPLDDFLGAAADLSSAIWVDVEGAMGKVMGGATRTLANCVALYGEIETKQRWAGQVTDQEVVPILLSYGLVPLLRDVQRHWQYNILCIRDALIDEHVSRRCAEIALQMGSASAVGGP
jgi:FkbM family methyltransferase